MKAPRTRPDWRHIKSHRNYTVEEIARIVGVAKVTVRRWIKEGLATIGDRKPVLVIGADLIEFHRAKKTSKQRCKSSECYCVKCRAPRSPAGGMAEYVPLTSTSGNLRAICPVCEKFMHRRVALASLAALRLDLDLSIPLEIEHLIDGGVAAANDGTAGGAIAAFKAAGVNPVPPVSGNDAVVAALQLIISGDQYNTISKPSEIVAAAAAQVAVKLLNGETVEAKTTLYNTPSELFVPTVVTRDNIKAEIFDKGIAAPADICTGEYEAGCKELGIL